MRSKDRKQSSKLKTAVAREGGTSLVCGFKSDSINNFGGRPSDAEPTTKEMRLPALDSLLSFAFRGRPLNYFLAEKHKIPLHKLIVKGILREPADPKRFVPELAPPAVEAILRQDADHQPSTARDHLHMCILNSLHDWSHGTKHCRGDYFEGHDASWMLAIRAHHATQSFLTDFLIRGELPTQNLTEYYLLKPASQRKQIAHLLDALPKGNLRSTHNGVRPMHSPLVSDDPFLVFPKYSIVEGPRDASNCDGLGLLSDDKLLRILTGASAFKNVKNGPGYDYLIAEWVPVSRHSFKVVLSFIEMRFSQPGSPMKQGHDDILRKLSLVQASFSNVLPKLRALTDIPIEARLVVECYRDLDDSMHSKPLPPHVFLYDRAMLAQAYGPTIAEMPHFREATT